MARGHATRPERRALDELLEPPVRSELRRCLRSRAAAREPRLRARLRGGLGDGGLTIAARRVAQPVRSLRATSSRHVPTDRTTHPGRRNGATRVPTRSPSTWSASTSHSASSVRTPRRRTQSRRRSHADSRPGVSTGRRAPPSTSARVTRVARRGALPIRRRRCSVGRMARCRSGPRGLTHSRSSRP